MRLAVTDAPQIAIRLMLEHVIGGGRWWQVKDEPQQPAIAFIGDANAALPPQTGFAKRKSDVAALLGSTSGTLPSSARI